MSASNQSKLVSETWRRVCFHLDGLAIGTSVEAVHARGGFAALAEAQQPIGVEELADAISVRPGYLNLVFRLLELQGYITRSGHIADARGMVALTDAGHDWLACLDAYVGFADRVRSAQTLLAHGEVTTRPSPDGLPARVACHLAGPVTAAAMTALSRSGLFADGNTRVAIKDLPHPAIAGIVTAQGWAVADDSQLILNEGGQLALQFAAQYYYPVSYLPTLASVAGLLRGDTVAARDEAGTEGHVDRELDIAFSGLVFARTCRAPLFDLVLPLFDSADADAQPRAIVDCGGGDGTLLCELYEAIATRTRRGGALSTHPLAMIGVEYNPVAERVLGTRLKDRGVPGFVFAGDVGDPQAIASRLKGEGFAADDVLHVSKSVFHNRTFRGTPARGAGGSMGAFVAPDGAWLSSAQIETDLEDLFGAWRAILGRHGMVVIEAHIIAAALATARLGRSVMTSLEASHGYSHQYLLEIDLHRAAARRAGLRVLGQHDFGEPIMGAPIMSIDHYGV